MENQRFFSYIALAFVLYMIWLTWQKEHAPPPVAQQTNEQSRVIEESIISSSEDLPEIMQSESANIEKGLVMPELAQTNKALKKSQFVQVKTDTLELIIDTRGGDIRQLDLPTYPVSLEKQDQAFRLMQSDSSTYTAQSGLLDDKKPGKTAGAATPTHHAIYTAESTEYELLDGKDSLEVKLFWSGEHNIQVEKIFTFYRDSFIFDVTHRVINQGTSPWVGRQYQQLRHSPISTKRSWLRLPTYTGTAYYDGAYHKHSFAEVEEEPIKMSVKDGWVAILQHYFVSAWIPNPEEENRFYSKAVKAAGEQQLLIGMLSPVKTVQANSSADFTSRLFAGPKLQHKMKQIAQGLDLSVDYGIFSVLSKPLFWLLEWFHKLVGNWGVAIILVTVVVKLVFFKLSEASYKSMARMRKVQPRFKALRERYADDKAKLNQAVMEMYKKEKINPLGGCLPILVQMPVFLSLYWVLVESVELRQAPFMFWINDLSLRDPIFVLPLLMGISMYVQFKLNPAPPDPMQAKVFAMMPIMMTVFMAFFPAGLVLYWTMNNILSISQQYVITKRVENAA